MCQCALAVPVPVVRVVRVVQLVVQGPPVVQVVQVVQVEGSPPHELGHGHSGERVGAQPGLCRLLQVILQFPFLIVRPMQWVDRRPEVLM